MKNLVTLILLMCFSSGWSQDQFQVGVLPEINLNYKFHNRWSSNFKIESRAFISEGLFDGTIANHFKYAQTDLSGIIAYKTGLNSKLTGGYLLRITTLGIEHRAIQQFSIIQTIGNSRLGHRIAADQTFASTATPEFRIRYRLSFDYPLQGAKIDPKEFYCKVSNEYLWIINKGQFDLEIRAFPSLGFLISEINKIELGLDYRYKNILKSQQNHQFWIAMSWYVSLKN